MPYHVVARGQKFCVLKGKTGESGKSMGCHDTRDDAVKQMKALYASEKKKQPNASNLSITVNESIDPAATAATITASLANSKKGTRIRLYFSEGEKTPDGRYIDPYAINFDRLPPYPFRIQTRQPESGGHAGAELAGVLTKFYRDGTTLVLEGPLDLGSEAGRETERLIKEGILQTWSPDLGDVYWDEEVEEMDAEGHATRILSHVTKGMFLGATAVAIPALGNAVMELVDEDGNVVVPALVRGIAADATVDSTNESTFPSIGAALRSLTAAVDVPRLPASSFTKPVLDSLQRYNTVTPEGRVYGHVASYDECHIGYLNRCISINEIADCNGNGDFEFAYAGFITADDDSRIPVGPIPIKGGHADRSLSWQAARSHYDDPASVVAYVVYGMDEFGLWYSGHLSPLATPEMVFTFLAHGVSLDAREINGDLRYLATCCVNLPGFQKLGVRLVADGEVEEDARILSLVAAGGAPQPAPGLIVDEEFTDLELRVLTTRVAASL